MEKLKEFINPNFYIKLKEIELLEYKIKDFVFDKHVKVEENFSWSRLENGEESFTHKDFKMLLAVIDVGVADVLLGVLYNSSLKKPYKLITMTNSLGSKLIIEGALEEKAIDEADLINEVKHAAKTLTPLTDFTANLEHLTSNRVLPRTWVETMGTLVFMQDVPTSLLKKATTNIPTEIVQNAVSTLLRVNTYLYQHNLSTYLNYSSKLLAEVAFIAQEVQREDTVSSAVFQAALSVIRDQSRNALVTFALTGGIEEVKNVHN